MRVGNYSVVIPQGVERDSGHVAMEHGRQYALQLRSHDHRQCDAEVVIDGKAVGTFRLSGYGSTTLERMPDDRGRLTFYSAGSDDAGRAGESSILLPDKGLIQVRFVPERRPVEQPKSVMRWAGPIGMCSFSGKQSRSAGEEKTSGGITGLSGHSDQRFVDVGAIDRDEFAAVTISLRLITASNDPRPLRAAVSCRENPVPVPV